MMVRMNDNHEELFENEWFIVRHSGETPEIAYNSAIYYLTRSKEGPHLDLNDQQIELLQKAAITRSREIIFRDLDHGNSDKSLYRGVARSIVNFNRYMKFCGRQNIKDSSLIESTRDAFTHFLETEIEQIEERGGRSIINCSYDELLVFADQLQLNFKGTFEVLKNNCPLPAS